MPHSIIHRNACFAYFNKMWGIPIIAILKYLVRSDISGFESHHPSHAVGLCHYILVIQGLHSRANGLCGRRGASLVPKAPLLGPSSGLLFNRLPISFPNLKCGKAFYQPLPARLFLGRAQRGRRET